MTTSKRRSDLSVRSFLDLSTAHLREETRANLSSYEDVLAHKTTCGWLVYATEDADLADDNDWPSELPPIIKLARAHGCEYILFDADAPVTDALPTFADQEMLAAPGYMREVRRYLDYEDSLITFTLDVAAAQLHIRTEPIVGDASQVTHSFATFDEVETFAADLYNGEWWPSQSPSLVDRMVRGQDERAERSALLCMRFGSVPQWSVIVRDDTSMGPYWQEYECCDETQASALYARITRS